jgi:hypothetical protein
VAGKRHIMTTKSELRPRCSNRFVELNTYVETMDNGSKCCSVPRRSSVPPLSVMTSSLLNAVVLGSYRKEQNTLNSTHKTWYQRLRPCSGMYISWVIAVEWRKVGMSDTANGLFNLCCSGVASHFYSANLLV